MRGLVIGNIALDESFTVAALPRPGETVLAADVDSDLGGKGANQAVVLARCGVATRFVARVGTDAAATRLRALLAAEPLDITGMIASGLPTDRSIVLRAADGENCIVSTAFCARALDEADIESAILRADAETMLLLQGNMAHGTTMTALRLARARGLRTVLTPAPVASWLANAWPLLDLAVMNSGEARELTRQDDPADAARHIIAAGTRCVVITLGADGALLHDGKGLASVPAVSTEVCDTTGAGDTFTAVLAAALLARQMDRVAALRAAARAAALTVSRRGTLASFPTEAELRAIFACS